MMEIEDKLYDEAVRRGYSNSKARDFFRSLGLRLDNKELMKRREEAKKTHANK